MILVDTTDHIGPISRTDILARLADFAPTTETAEMILVYDTTPIVAGLQSDGNPFPPILQICNPGDPAEASEWTSNPDLVRQQFEEAFKQPIEQLLSDLVYLGEPAHQSPLILVSDLLQHSENLSLYRGLPDLDDFAGTTGGVALRTNLQDVHVEVLFVERREHDRFGSPRRLIDFWDRWVDDQEGELTRVSRVDGLN